VVWVTPFKRMVSCFEEQVDSLRCMLRKDLGSTIKDASSTDLSDLVGNRGPKSCSMVNKCVLGDEEFCVR
jgi:hypothetical protein